MAVEESGSLSVLADLRFSVVRHLISMVLKISFAFLF